MAAPQIFSALGPGNTVSPFTVPVQAGDYLVAVLQIGNEYTATPVPGLSDDHSNDWIPISIFSGQADPTGSFAGWYFSFGMFYCIANATATITITPSVPLGQVAPDFNALYVNKVRGGTSLAATAFSGIGTTALGSITTSSQLPAYSVIDASFPVKGGATVPWVMLLVTISGDTDPPVPIVWIVSVDGVITLGSGYGDWDFLIGDAVQYFYHYFPLTGSSLPASDVVTDICERAGLLSSQIDVSLLTNANIQPNVTVPGYLIEQPRPAAEILKVLMQAYFFDGCESGGKMRWVPRGMGSAISIPESDLGLIEDKAELEESLAQAQDLPQQITVIHDDPVLDYQQNKQLKVRSAQIVGSTRQNITLRIPMTMNADFARQVAEKALFLAWLERSSYKFNLWRALYMMLDPTDVITFTYEGLTFTARVSENTIGQGFVVELQCVNENATNYLSSATGGTVQGYQTTPSILVAPTQLFLFDIPLIEDTDSNSGGTGYYFGMGSTASDYAGGLLYDSSDDSDFKEVTDSPSSLTVFGYATTILGAPRSPWIWDTVNSLTVKLSTGSLSGDSGINVLNGSQWYLVGDEIIAAQNAVQNSDGTWTISNLLRGLRGTEAFCGTHGSNELVILISSGLERQPASLGLIGVPTFYKGVSIGQDVSTAGSEEFTLAGADLKPYAPSHIGGTVDGSGDIIITWARRTRIGGEADWADGVTDVPLSEDSESYDVEILNGSTVVRTIAGLSTAAAVYTSAMQTTDFGSSQASVNVNVYQRSSQVGRGYKATGSAPSSGPAAPWPATLPGSQLFYVNGS